MSGPFLDPGGDDDEGDEVNKTGTSSEASRYRVLGGLKREPLLHSQNRNIH